MVDAPQSANTPAPLEDPYPQLEDPYAQQTSPQATSPGVAPAAPAQATPQGAQGPASDPNSDWNQKPAWWDLSGVADRLAANVGLGILRAGFETKDFLTGGETPEADRSLLRQYVDEQGKEQHGADKLVSGVSQFATGMIGAGKVAGMAKAGAALEAGGSAIYSSVKAAWTGATAFDPHEGNLANVVQSVPALQNPVSDFLSAKPGDPEGVARVKNAMLSIGLDATLAGTFALSLKAFKYMKSGEDAAPALKELADHISAADQNYETKFPRPEPANGNDPSAAGTNDNAPNPSSAAPSLTPAEQAEFNLKWAAKEADNRDAQRAARDRMAANVTADNANTPGYQGNGPNANDNLYAPSQGAPLPSGQDFGGGLPDRAGPIISEHVGDAPQFSDTQAGLPPDQTGKVSTKIEMRSPTAPAPPKTAIPDHVAEPGEPPRVTTALQYQVNETNKAAQGAMDASGQPLVTMVKNATEGGAPRGGQGPSIPMLGDEHIASIISTAQKDADALAKWGTWDNAVANGHVFGDGTNIPWQKVATNGSNPSSTLDAYITRVANILKGQLDETKGGSVVGDAQNAAMVNQRANLWNQDPAQLMGMLQRAGEGAADLRANMQASFLVAQRVMQDAYTLAARINAGYFQEFGGSREAAIAAFKQVQSVAADAYAQANSMKANAGRALRGMRREFGISPTDVENIRSADPEMMLKLMSDTGGDPKAIAAAIAPKLWEPGGLGYAAKKFGDAAQYLLINNLISNGLTHAVIGATNAFQVLSRPMERIVGSAVQRSFLSGADAATAGQVGQAAKLQYTYMRSVFFDSLDAAKKAWNVGDAVMAPHMTEVSNGGQGAIGQEIAQMGWKPLDSVSNLLSNVYTAALKTVGAPSRFVGAQDELVKQIVYRSKVLAEAHVEGSGQGLDGDALNQFVKARLASSFDEAGRATNARLLQEAKVATYQQDLLPGTFGKATSDYRNNYPALKVIIPFCNTPANLFRNGVKLTPGLNLVQTEYRQMLSGAMGVEQQAQAIGQMATGSLLMATAATLAYEGRITGGGPSDKEAKASLINSGWRPYSFAKQNPDGTMTYIPYGRFDPVAMPMGIIADSMSVFMHPDPIVAKNAHPMMEAVATGLLKSLTDKLYLQNLVHTLQAIDDPDSTMWKVAGSTAGEYVPLASGLNAVNQDPNMREARTFTDRALMRVPGFSQDMPAKYDAWGDPVSAHKGLWLTDKGSIVDHEMNRMATEQSLAMGGPSPQAKGHVDLRQLKMQDGSDAYEKLQQLSAQPTPGMPRLKDQVAKLIGSDTYKNVLVDGPADTQGTRLSAILGIVHNYRTAAQNVVNSDPNVRQAEYKLQRDTAAAVSARAANPTPANRTSQMLDSLGKSFGMDLHAVTGAAPLAPGAKVAQ